MDAFLTECLKFDTAIVQLIVAVATLATLIVPLLKKAKNSNSSDQRIGSRIFLQKKIHQPG
jgi:hypothetical protein